jgi:hypothetical protein
MSRDLFQVYTDNPASTVQSTDLFYLGRSPYGVTNDMGVLASTIFGQIPGYNWTDVVTATKTLSAQNGYITDNGAVLITYTLPATAALGSIIEIAGKSSGLFSIAQLAGQKIIFGNQSTTVGVGGSLTSTNVGEYLKLLCITANTTYLVIGVIGNPTVV